MTRSVFVRGTFSLTTRRSSSGRAAAVRSARLGSIPRESRCSYCGQYLPPNLGPAETSASFRTASQQIFKTVGRVSWPVWLLQCHCPAGPDDAFLTPRRAVLSRRGSVFTAVSCDARAAGWTGAARAARRHGLPPQSLACPADRPRWRFRSPCASRTERLAPDRMAR